MKKSGKKTGAEGVKWNLGDLYKGLNDKKIASDLKRIHLNSKKFEKKYRNKNCCNYGKKRCKENY